ncbi:hypothetical protein Bca4012_019621 [Brassica carinata]|uniref:DUF4283 domain-containing protein n=1 Tax=Brassica carinata TaxID=52824 RepID=A0A8X7WJ85_BRACI|nr:hypothetical protein Bca52824_001934 [Brassica carinata]
MNPQKQDMKTLLFMLPRIWQVEGWVVGSDLGLGRFQFYFEVEDDIKEVLKMEPFHFDYWMVALVRWKPVLEANYPSKITFWVRVLDMPLQFRAAQTLQSIGKAIGQVQGEVDVVGGRVRVELDGTMAIEFEEGVEIMVSLRYEKLFGFCKECFCRTHEKIKCPKVKQEETSVSEVKGNNGVLGVSALSYKTAVAHGTEADEGRRDGQHNRVQATRDGNKGKGVIREKPGPYRYEGSYHAYKERLPRGNGEGSSFKGRHYGYPNRKFATQSRGFQNPSNGDGDQVLNNPEKLMMAAFKGLNRSPSLGIPPSSEGTGKGTGSKVRKAMLFEDNSSGVDDSGNAVAAFQIQAERVNEMDEVQVQRVPEGVKRVAGQEEEIDPSQTLDDANLIVEGVILSDSELMVEDDLDDMQEWEQGEITDLMEEEAAVDQDLEVEEYGEADQGIEDALEKVPKRKTTKPGMSAMGGSTKMRNLQNLISPRKKTLAKAATRAGGKGVAASKKAATKP